MQPADAIPLLGSSFFNYSHRPRRDQWWSYAYVAILVATTVGGVYAFIHSDPKSFNPDYLSDARHCPLPNDPLLGNVADDFKPDFFLQSVGTCILVSILAALVAGLLFVWLLTNCAAAVVVSCVVMQVLLPFGMGAAIYRSGNTGPGLTFIVMGICLALVYYLWREQLGLVSRLIKVSAQGLTANAGLLGVAVFLQMVLLLLVVPMAVATLLAGSNGVPVPNPLRGGSPQCVDDQGKEVTCCSWQVDSWVPYYLTLTGIAFLWSVMLIYEIKVFTVAGTISQWYFAPINSPASPFQRITTSLGHALGPSFGSLCEGSALLTLCNLARSALQQAREDSSNVLFQLFAACLDLMYQILENLTRFATIRLAMTGEDFWTAGAGAVQLLTRHLLSTVAVWWFPPMILNLSSILLAALWGYATYLVSHLVWGHGQVAYQSAIIMAVVSAVFAFLVVAFFCSVFLNVIEAVYYCFAVDLDEHICTKLEVHEVFSELPTVPASVVENPDGNLGLATGSTPPSYQPPRQVTTPGHAPDAYPPIKTLG